MPAFSLGSRALIEVRVIIPEQGIARAWTEIDGETAISGQQVLELAGGTTFAGTIIAGGASDTRILANWAQGLGLLASVPSPGQHYFEATPRSILKSIITDAGEVLNPDLPPICDQPIDRWMRLADTPDVQLGFITKFLNLTWWLDPDGRVRVGVLDYPEVTPGIDVFPLDSPEWKRLDFASDDVTIMPRTSVVTDYGIYKVSEVRYTLSKGRWRGTFYYVG
jgi:hypothetical protein